MSYQVTIYSPDQHIEYYGWTPWEEGIGGGITARIRMAEALAAADQKVEVIANCRAAHEHRGVRYIPINEVREIDTDILILNTSGDLLDLRPLLLLRPKARMRIVWIQGFIKPKGLYDVGFDFIYAISNFLRDVAHTQWEIPESQIFVAYNPFPDALIAGAGAAGEERNQYRLVYFSHPSKGRDAALDIVGRLRSQDERYELVVFGGNRLWGQPDTSIPTGAGVESRGLIGQKQLMQELQTASFAINIQNREEPFGNAVIEAMRAGCVVIASPVGAFAEIVQHGRDGFIVHGDANDRSTREHAAELIHRLIANTELIDAVRTNAATIPWSQETLARTWLQHWMMYLSDDVSPKEPLNGAILSCPACNSPLHTYPDGYHCTVCSRYHRALA